MGTFVAFPQRIEIYISIESDMQQASRLIYNVRIRNTVETLALLQLDYQPL